MTPGTAPGEPPDAALRPSPEPFRERLRRLARLDFAPAHRQPSGGRVALAAVLSIGASLLADYGLVRAGTALFPSSDHFSHFRLSDYAILTVIGVLVASAAWPVVTRVTSSPRWLFLRLAVVVTLVLWVPDLWILVGGEPAAGVAVLMVMHLAVAIVTYNMLVRLAPVGPAPAGADPAPRQLPAHVVRRAWSAMALLVALELVLGVVTIVLVPYRRGSATVPDRGTVVYVAHGAVGVALGVGALAVLAASLAADRPARIGAVVGAVGVAVGLGGGLAATFQATRLLGVGLMLVGVVVAGIGYLVPALEEFGRAERERAGVPPGVEPPPA